MGCQAASGCSRGGRRLRKSVFASVLGPFERAFHTALRYSGKMDHQTFYWFEVNAVIAIISTFAWLLVCSDTKWKYE